MLLKFARKHLGFETESCPCGECMEGSTLIIPGPANFITKFLADVIARREQFDCVTQKNRVKITSNFRDTTND